MLDLEPGVHLDEVEFAILVEELDRAGAAIAHLAIAFATMPPIRARSLGVMTGTALPPALSGDGAGVSNRARQDGSRCHCLAEDLELDVARIAEIFLHVDGIVAKRCLALRRGPGCIRLSSWSSLGTTFIPRPPPPEAALINTG